jgi:hypothetical protein
MASKIAKFPLFSSKWMLPFSDALFYKEGEK